MSREMLRIVAYDVSCDRRRNRIADVLSKVGVRVQESVFEARLDHRSAEQLYARLVGLAGAEDSVRLYTVPDSALRRCHANGGPELAAGGRFWLV